MGVGNGRRGRRRRGHGGHARLLLERRLLLYGRRRRRRADHHGSIRALPPPLGPGLSAGMAVSGDNSPASADSASSNSNSGWRNMMVVVVVHAVPGRVDPPRVPQVRRLRLRGVLHHRQGEEVCGRGRGRRRRTRGGGVRGRCHCGIGSSPGVVHHDTTCCCTCTHFFCLRQAHSDPDCGPAPCGGCCRLCRGCPVAPRCGKGSLVRCTPPRQCTSPGQSGSGRSGVVLVSSFFHFLLFVLEEEVAVAFFLVLHFPPFLSLFLVFLLLFALARLKRRRKTKEHEKRKERREREKRKGGARAHQERRKNSPPSLLGARDFSDL